MQKEAKDQKAVAERPEGSCSLLLSDATRPCHDPVFLGHNWGWVSSDQGAARAERISARQGGRT